MDSIRINVLDNGYVELQDVMGDDLAIVNAARVSYLGESKGEEKDKKLLFYLMNHRHTTPFEMVEFKFRVKCPLFIRSQWHRHRTWNYNEVSRRYTDEDIQFYYPQEWRLQDTVNKQGSVEGTLEQDEASTILANSVGTSITAYNLLLEMGVAREMARMVLPQNMYTEFIAKVDAHNLMHFIRLRIDVHAQYEMRLYAKALLTFMEQTLPWTTEAFRFHNDIP